MLARVLNRAALVVVPTESYRKLITDKYHLDPQLVRVQSYGTNMELRGMAELTPWDPGRPVRLVTIGRVASEKNLPLLIDAVDVLVARERLDVELEIVGDGPAWDRVAQHISERGLENRVTMVGRLGGTDLIEAFDRSDLFVMTSLTDSFGIVLIEAMARGLPVIAPNITGVRDVVIDGTTGLLVDHTVDSVCKAVLRVLHEPGLRDHLIVEAQSASSRYLWPEVARQFIQMYEEVLNRPEAESAR